MTVWRMSMRFGNQGYEMWPQCQRNKVAAIAYRPFAGVDVRKASEKKLSGLWERMEAPQRGFLRRVAYDMKKGDIIYVKQGPQIVGKGTVLGPYEFDQSGRIICPNRPDLPFAHQVPVKWDANFEPIDVRLGSEPSTVLELKGKRLMLLKRATAKAKRKKQRRGANES